MFLSFNELSLSPTTDNNQIIALLQLAKSSKEKQLSDGSIRFAQELRAYSVANTNTNNNPVYVFDNFLNAKTVSPTYKNLLLSVYKYPFYNDEDEPQVSEYIQKQFSYQQQRCDGLAIAYVYKKLAISIEQTYWKNRPTICIECSNDQDPNSQPQTCEVLHIATAQDLNNSQIQEWQNQNIQHLTQEPTDVSLASLYPNYTFEKQAVDDLQFWYAENKELYQKAHLILVDIFLNPHIGGISKTEVLRRNNGISSKRLSSEHRIRYKMEGTDRHITVFSCKGHYE